MRLVDRSAPTRVQGEEVPEIVRTEIAYAGHEEGARAIQALFGVGPELLRVFWAAHQVDLAYAQLERLCGLRELPPTGFRVACFPLRIERASAAPARVVGIVG